MRTRLSSPLSITAVDCLETVFILGISAGGGNLPPKKFEIPPKRKIHIKTLQPYNNSNAKSVKYGKLLKLLPSDAFPRLKICQKCVCGRGSAPDPAGGAYSRKRISGIFLA